MLMKLTTDVAPDRPLLRNHASELSHVQKIEENSARATRDSCKTSQDATIPRHTSPRQLWKSGNAGKS